MQFLSVFAERLKELMDDNNLNTLSLQKLSGIKNNNISNWLNKKFIPATKHLITLSTCFNCSIDFLTGKTELPDISSTEIVSSVSERIITLVEEKSTTINAVALDLKIDATILYRWKNKKCIPNVFGLIMLANYFDCSIDYLIGRN